jgi:hypothetical protein
MATPYVLEAPHTQALKGRNQSPNGISPFQGLGVCGEYPVRRALPYATDNKAFSLNLTAMGLRIAASLCPQ